MVWYTDGSAHPNPGPGGFGAVLIDEKTNKVVKCYQEQRDKTTNNEMELSAITYVLENYGTVPDWGMEIPVVYTDSSYSYNIFTKWMFGWAAAGWIKSDKKIPENLTIIKKFYTIYNTGKKIDLKLIRGHEGILGNEIADKLATGKMTEEEVLKIYG